jgi:arylsulfatase A-like enzyme
MNFALLDGDGRVVYRRGLERYAPFFLVLDFLVVAALVFYRLRALSLLEGISPELVAEEGRRAYLASAALSDALGVAFVLVILALAWLSAPALKWASLLPAILVATASSLFQVLATDFLRVYQVAFGKSYIGGEHFTGVKSMLMSAASEVSPISRVAVFVLLALLPTCSVLSLRFVKKNRPCAAFEAMRILSVAAALSLAASAFATARAEARASENHSDASGSKGAELGKNPLGALVFGPKRATFMPALAPAPAFYDTDSLESPKAFRDPPVVKKGKRNVILYFFESTSWRYFDLESGGERVLPAMRELAKQGFLLKNHYSNYPLSANTLYSVLSSRYSMYGKAMIFHEYYDVDVHTLPEVLHDEGYATCFIHTGDLLYASRHEFLANRDIDELILGKDLMKDGRYRKNVGWGADERAMIDPALSWIKAQKGPYFLMMAPVNPHHPYAIPADFPRIADPDEEGIGTGERNRRNYLNSLHYADAAMGLFVEALEREGLMENTVFVMVTDHGEAFYQHKGNYNHPLFIYEENVHVPALFYGKSILPPGIEFESTTRHIDIMPSILDLLGVRDSGRRDGESIFSRSREKMAVFHTSWSDELMGVRDGKWKYIKRMKDSREELYDLDLDPWEKADVASANPAIIERYRNAVDSMVAYMIDQYRDIPRKRPKL